MVLTTTTLALRRNYRLSSIRLDTGVELAIGEVVISLNFEISLFFLSKYIRPFSNSKFWGVCVCPSYFDAERESARYVLHLTTFLLLVFNIYNRPGPLFFRFRYTIILFIHMSLIITEIKCAHLDYAYH